MTRKARLVTAAVLVGLAALVAVPAIALVAISGFDGLYGQDAFGYVDYALRSLRPAVAALELPPWFFWPPGYPALIVLAAPVVGDGLGGLVVSLIAGASLPIATAALASQLRLPLGPPAVGHRDRWAVALLAGAFVAVAGQLLQSSVVAMADTAGATAATLGAAATARFDVTRRRRWLAAGAAAIALACTTRWVYGLVAIAVGAAALASVLARLRDPGRERRESLVDLGVGTAAALLVAAPTAVPMLAAVATGAALPFAADLAAYHWSLANVAQRSFETIDGRLEYDVPTGLYYVGQALRRGWLFLLAPLAVPGLLAIGRRPRVMVVAVLVAWPLLVVGFLAGGGYQNARFFLAAFPPVAILGAAGTHALWRLARHLGQRAGKRAGPLLQAGLALAVAAAMALNLAWGVGNARAFIDRQMADLAAIRSLAAQVPAGGRVLTLGAGTVLGHDGGTTVVELYYLDAPSVEALVADGRPTYVLVDASAMRTQWAAEGAGRAFAALEAAPGLERVGTAGIWTLFRLP